MNNLQAQAVKDDSEAIMANSNEIEYPNEATIGDQWRRELTTEEQGKLALSFVPDLHHLISDVAYDLYLRRGKLPGHDREDWLEAENMVLSRLAKERETDFSFPPANGC